MNFHCVDRGAAISRPEGRDDISVLVQPFDRGPTYQLHAVMELAKFPREQPVARPRPDGPVQSQVEILARDDKIGRITVLPRIGLIEQIEIVRS
jgi:hypothetical protein